jgi:hypothetical protein
VTLKGSLFVTCHGCQPQKAVGGRTFFTVDNKSMKFFNISTIINIALDICCALGVLNYKSLRHIALMEMIKGEYDMAFEI